MYTKSIPFKDVDGKACNETVNFMLFERDVFRLLPQLKAVFDWQDSMKGEKRELTTEEVVEFYTNFEEILLAAYGKPSADRKSFNRGNRYEFEETALFNACMVEFITNPQETGKLLDDILPKGMEDLVRKADDNLAKASSETKDEDMQAEIARLRAQLQQQNQNA